MLNTNGKAPSRLNGTIKTTGWFAIASMLLLVPRVTAIPLLNGRFETTTDVQYILDLALDAAAMKEANSVVSKTSIYQNGVEQEGTNAADRVTLQSLSLNAKDTMSQSPMYNIFRHAFLVLGNANEGETEGNFDDAPVGQYGDTLVNDLISLNIPGTIEAEAALVMAVWMSAVHELFQVLQECKAIDAAKGLAALDKAAAFWIGEGQVEGSNEQGHLLYNLAENAGERFDQDDGEAAVNTQVIAHFLTMQTHLNADKCSNDQGYRELRGMVKQTVGLMTIPLVQNLIHHSMNLQNEGGNDYVELYALATIPRVAACDPDAYDEELHLDVMRELKPNQAHSSIAAIQKAYSCLDITCAQVGTYLGGTVPECKDESTVTVVGYDTDRPGSAQKIKLDRDIEAIDIFLRFEAYGAAEDWYTYGWNADGYSLQALAQNQVVPSVTDNSYITTFQNYYSEDNFADNMIANMLNLVPPYNSASKEQVRNMVTGTLTNVVMFMTSATSLQYAVQQCGTDPTTALDFWDTGALFYIGSMEGKEVSGSLLGGELMFAAARELCTEFGTCVTEAAENNGVALAAANEVVIEGLKQAINSIFEGSCDVAKGLLENQILPSMIIPLIQGTIKYASFNAGLEKGTTDSSLAIGSTYALGLLPIVDQSNPASAGTIMENMEFQLSMQPVSDGFATVSEAMRNALDGMSTACSDIGDFEDEPLTGRMCQDEESASPTAEAGPPENMAFGRYTFQDQEVANGVGSFALDVRDIFQASNAEDAYVIYINGTKAKTGLPGIAGTTSLASLSSEATKYMTEDPMFNIFRYALYDDEDLDDNSGEDFLYANEVVLEALSTAKDNKLAAEAAVVLNSWMVLVHQLYEAMRLCRDKQDPVPLIDSAVAFWIGKGQQEGKFDQGWMLYSVAQSAAKFYGLKEGEAAVNAELMELFNDAQAVGKTCSESDDAGQEMYFIVHELVRTLSKPLILTMLFHLASDSNNMRELYAVSILPQAAACNEATWTVLEKTLFGDQTQITLTDDVIDHLAAFLRCQKITREDLQHTNAADEDFRNLLNSLVDKVDHHGWDREQSIAGYDTKTDTTEIARLDMDALEIQIMMRTEAYTTAQDIYEQGHNAYDGDSDSRYLSMKSLATSSGSHTELPQNTLQEYYGSKFVADDIIVKTLSRTGEFASATRSELAEISTRTLQTMVSYNAVFEKMLSARDFCWEEQDSGSETGMWNAAVAWDQAVALFVGSIEGRLAGGRPDGEGTFLYALFNEVCADFDTCESSGESTINQDLITQFAAGRDAIADRNCDHLRRIHHRKIIPLFSTALVQATISSVVRNTDLETRDEVSNVTAYIFSKAIVPLVDQSNSTSRVTIENALGDLSTISTSEPVAPIIQAFAYALRGMGIDCSDVGVPVGNPDLSLCLEEGDNDADNGDDDDDQNGNVPDQAPIAETPTNLGDGLYVTTTYVQDRADIAKDVADLQEALESDSYAMAKLIYKDGKNSDVYDENGMFESLRSLRSFSTQETNEMQDEPLFNIFTYALRNEEGKFMAKDARLYADSLVEDAFNNINTRTKTLPVEATLALNLWMHIAHLLYETLKYCKNKEIANEDGIHSLDIAVAYWIGDGQVAGSGDNGHLLYAMAERMGERFNMDKGGQSRTNTNILKLFNEAKNVISLPGSCSESPSSYLQLSQLVNKITSLMAVPLIQNLIHSLRMDDRARVKLYAHSVIPLAAGCSPEAFAYLKEKLLHMTYNAVEVDDIIMHIRSIYPCLGLTCSDVGVHETETADEDMECEDPDDAARLAGYKPHHGVSDYARLDLDIRQLDILLQMKAYAAAENLYTYGKHLESSDGSLSLFHLATTNDRSSVPQYDDFLQYYGSMYEDPKMYADQIIRSALTNTGYLWDDDQRRIIVLKSAQVMVMYFGALHYLFEASSNCGESTHADSDSRRLQHVGHYWDKGAALLIGSLEGTEANGTHHGYMYYDLAEEHCAEFGTCHSDGTAVKANDQLVTLLYTGRGALLSNSCESLHKAVDEISTLLLVPVIQGALSSAFHLSTSKGAEARLYRAESYVYSRALLPLVAAANWGASQTIDSYLGFPEPASPRKTVSEVFSAFAKVYPEMDVDCESLGTIDGNDPCSGVVYEDGNQMIWIIVGSALGSCLLCTVAFLFLRSRKSEGRLPENNPRFIIPETGELNHSMDLLEKAFSSNSNKPRMHTRLSETAALTEDMYTDASSGEDSSDHSSTGSSTLEVI